MGHFTDSEANRKRFQLALIAAGKIANPPYDCGPDGADGVLGNDTAKAVDRYRRDHNLGSGAVIDNKLLHSLNLTTEPIVQLPQIGATAADYFLNFISSKIVWAAGAIVVFGVGWINTRFGFNVPPEIQNLVTGWIITGGMALIAILRTFFSAPKVVTKMPETVTTTGAAKSP